MPPREAPKHHRLLLALAVIFLPVAPVARADAPPPLTKGIEVRELPVTTSFFANTLCRGRGWGPDVEPSAQRWVMDWISSIAVTPDGYVFGTTTYEEGIQRTGVYRDGDNVLDRPEGGAPEGTAVAATAHWLALGHGGGKEVWLYQRLPGMALDGQNGKGTGHKRVIAVNDLPDYISGIALDEPRDRLYVSYSAQSRVKVFKLSDGARLAEFPVYDGRVHPSGPDTGGGLAVDGDGNLWIIEAYQAAHPVQVPGTYCASGPAAAGSAPIEVLATAAPDKYFSPDGRDSWVAIDLGAAHRLSLIHYKGDDSWKGAKLQSANELGGPWTDRLEFARGVHEWPDEWLWLDDAAAYRYYRFLSPPGQKLAVGMFEAYEQAPAQDGRVLCYGPDGQKREPQIDVAQASGICWDAVGQRLLLGDNGPAQQVYAYVDLATKPRLDPTFGVAGKLGTPGGIHAGGPRDQGKMGPLRFDFIRGVGADAEGRIYVATMGADGTNQTQLECYTPKGERIWWMFGGAFEDMAALDPAAETEVYTGHHHYRMDYTKRAGNEWSLVGAVQDIRKYDNQMITTMAGLRRINGTLYMVLQADRGWRANVFRFDPAQCGEFAKPMAILRGMYHLQEFTKFPWPPNQVPGLGRFIWNDLNSDGRFTADEFDKSDDYLMGPGAYDDDLHYWFYDEAKPDKVIRTIAAVGPDAKGNLAWHWSHPQNREYALPEPFVDPQGKPYGIGSVTFDKASGCLFLTGADAEHPLKVMAGQHRGFGQVLAKYRLAEGKLVLAQRTILPVEVNLGAGDHDSPYAIALAGDYVFVGYWNMMTVRIYRQADLAYVGQVSIGKQACAAILDGTAAIRVAKRTAANEYLIFAANYGGNSVLMLRWLPAVDAAPAPPEGFKIAPAAPTAMTLTWQPSPGATGYRVERMVSTRTGWTEWQEIGQPAEPHFADTVQPAQTYAYRVRAFSTGTGGGNSDYTVSLFTTSAK